MRKTVYICLLLLFSTGVMSQNHDETKALGTDYCSYFQKNIELPFPQTSASVVDGWVYDTFYSDEFNGNSIDQSKWEVKDHYYHPNNNSIGYLADNVSIVGGNLVLSVTQDIVGQYYHYHLNDTTYPILCLNYATGGISSTSYIRYGYYEVECYLPKNHRYHPCFWTIGGDSEYDEIDVFELTNGTNSPYRFLQNEYSNVHDNRSSKTKQVLTLTDSITGKTSRFGVEVLPYEIVFYVNGQVTSRLLHSSSLANSTNAFTCSDITKTVPMEVMLTFSTDVSSGIPQPHEDFVVNYFRCYKLVRGDTETYHPTAFTPSSESCKVYPHVILGGTGCTATITSSTAVWAEQDIILDKGFELSATTAFSARVIQHGDEDPQESPLYIGNCTH